MSVEPSIDNDIEVRAHTYMNIDHCVELQYKTTQYTYSLHFTDFVICIMYVTGNRMRLRVRVESRGDIN